MIISLGERHFGTSTFCGDGFDLTGKVANKIATGHFANLDKDKKSGRFILKEGKDKAKDQSYFLFDLAQEQLKRAFFPLSGLSKKEVRQIARSNDLKVHDKPESQDICFVTNGDYRDFIKDRIKTIRPGIV